MSENSRPRLYSYFRSSCAWRVRIALAYKGIQYETIPVNLLKREQNDEKYTKINKMAQVPTLEMDGRVLTQSLAILEYLEETHPTPPLLPKDPFLRARVRQLAEIIASGIQPLQNLSVITKVSDDQDKRTDFAHHWIVKGLDAFEKVLEETSGQYCVGDAVTLADICLAPQVVAAERFKVRLDNYPHIARINNNLNQLEPFQLAHMVNQPDTPDEFKKAVNIEHL
ncbi:LOW QUALITY PROTEIN: maleylacetoacetate isomerase-like [Paramacrobiotus metropolitanus]|uniref:LOW QUALITY PROTEIN: maleylacetoacetate isomerase-like n=1 Tax=Paramacrobiotus metropolitanus TaxID=2943436 RepID=UPI0024458125|nr:LOW QUALITY PROTEIN: maleylacetoacetate isomerase-like [Paramacrobiotus metropolitanus]